MYTVAGPIVLPPIRYGPSLQMRALRPRQLYGLYYGQGGRDDQAKGRPLWTWGSTVCRRLLLRGYLLRKIQGFHGGPGRAPRPPWSEARAWRPKGAPLLLSRCSGSFQGSSARHGGLKPLRYIWCHRAIIKAQRDWKGTRIDPTREPHRPAHHGSPQLALPGVWPRQATG